MAAKEKTYDVSVQFGAIATSTVIVAPLEDEDPSEFDRFEDLAGKLVQVPKNELDEKLKKP